MRRIQHLFVHIFAFFVLFGFFFVILLFVVVGIHRKKVPLNAIVWAPFSSSSLLYDTVCDVVVFLFTHFALYVFSSFF